MVDTKMTFFQYNKELEKIIQIVKDLKTAQETGCIHGWRYNLMWRAIREAQRIKIDNIKGGKK